MTTRDADFMRLALDACRHGIELGQSPFGACIARGDDVLIATHNTVWQETDPTSHAEVHAIRQACRQGGSVQLEGCTIYSTTEPCPMCFGAIHWARITRIVYAARVEDAKSFGFHELQISNRAMKEVSASPIELTPDLLREEALELYRFWQSRQGKAY